MKVLGIDYGSKRIGVAIGDSEFGLARPLTTIATSEWHYQLDRLIGDEHPVRLVVGLPRGLDGQETAQTAAVQQFAAELERTFRLPVEFQDEAATSVVADERLAESGRHRIKGDIDAEAAAIITQDYLDGLDAQT